MANALLSVILVKLMGSQAADPLIQSGDVKAWVPRAFKAFAQRHALHVIGTRGLPWTEIDFPEDYRRAVEVVLPAIERDFAILTTAPLFAQRVRRSA